MTRDGRIDNFDRDDYELAFSKVPDTPDALGQLAVDANTVHLMVKAGQVYKKLDEYRTEFERLSEEQQVSPYRAEQIAKQIDLLRGKMEVCHSPADALNASNQAMQTAATNKFLKDDKAAQLQNAGELERWCFAVKPPWMPDGQVSGAPPYELDRGANGHETHLPRRTSLRGSSPLGERCEPGSPERGAATRSLARRTAYVKFAVCERRTLLSARRRVRGGTAGAERLRPAAAHQRR